ncbi:protein FAM227A [Antechinus flavipes]|uniref:protein FAM227A n=1 Tax=Antechinus flavipes TaxID=38775 RepID=UPI0022358A67|nr:protein FAM227A [Antechinus flavipes]
MPLPSGVMETINFNAIPMIPLDDHLSTSSMERQKLHEEQKAYMKQNPPLCFVGSVGKVNKKIAQIDLKTRLHKTSIHSKILVIEKLEAEEELRQQQRIWGEKGKADGGKKASKAKAKIQKFSPLTSSISSVSYLASKKRIQKDGLVELYQAPPYNEEMPNELPNRVNYFEMVGNVVRAQGSTTLTGKPICAPAEMTKFFCCPYTRSIVLDCFWWLFHERYDLNKMTQRKLFDRVSENYAHLLLDLPNSGFKEVLLRIFPSLLSQVLYTSFCTCFPQSWFGNHEFKSFVCDTIHQWIGGTLPNPKSYMNWNYFELEPERFRREEMLRGPEKVSGVARYRTTSKLSKAEPQYKRQRQASKRVKEITEMRLLEKASQNESHPACRGPEFSKNVFSITGKSPLIVHYLQQHNAYQQTGQDILMIRREVSKTIPEGTATYRDVIRQVRANMLKLNKEMQRLREVYSNEWKLFEQSQKDIQSNFLREVKDISTSKVEKKTEDESSVYRSSGGTY